MHYLYRYDSLSSHRDLETRALRARFWSRKHPAGDSHPHRSLMAAEANLAEGQGIFRICFWKHEKAALDEARCSFKPEIYPGAKAPVIQRVHSDHAFFSAFRKEPDDWASERAWLFWHVASRSHEQRWSEPSIPRSDIEVLDLDGQWRPWLTSRIMAPRSRLLADLGFEPFHYQDARGPQTVHGHAGCIRGEDGQSDLVVLLIPQVQTLRRLYSDAALLEAILKRMSHRFSAVPSSRWRCMVMEEFDPLMPDGNLCEVGITQHAGNAGDSGRHCFFKHRRVMAQPVMAVDLDRMRIYAVTGLVGQRVLEKFGLLTDVYNNRHLATVLDSRRAALDAPA